MTLTARVLPRAEWRRLSETDVDLSAWLKLPEDTTRVVVVERDGEIVGCWTALQMMHFEGFWIAPAYRRRGSVLRRLLVHMQELLRGYGITQVLTLATTPEVRALLLTANATPVPGDTFMISIQGGDRLCPRRQR